MNYISYLHSIHFTQPFWFYVMVVIAVGILVIKHVSLSNLIQSLHLKNTYRHTRLNVILKILESQNSLTKKKVMFVGKIYYLIIIGLLFTCLAGPFYTGEKLPDPPSNRDIVFLVDNEVSMVLKDYFIDKQRVDRLTMVKSVLLNFVNKLSGNRISIVTFSEQAHTLLPFTTDTNLLKAMIPRITTTLTGRTSNPQRALLYTLNNLHNLKKNDSEAKPSIVLITDVLRPPRDIDPDVIAKYIKEKGYTLYVIAIGASSYQAEDVKDSTLIYHPASFERLKSIADAAGGKFYWAKNTNSLSEVIQGILQSRKSKLSISPQYIEIPLFQWPLAIALLLMLLQYIISLVHLRKADA